jgi:hypothetical protein
MRGLDVLFSHAAGAGQMAAADVIHRARSLQYHEDVSFARGPTGVVDKEIIR